MDKVTPRCKLNLTSGYISAQGMYFPCCWVGNEPHASALREFLGDRFKDLHIDTVNVNDIWGNEAIRKLEETWKEGTFKPCVFFCGKPIDTSLGDKVARRDSHFFIDLKTRKTQS